MFVPLPVGRNDRVRDHAALDRLLDRGKIVFDRFRARTFVASNPAIPAATDDPPVPFAVWVVRGERFALSIEMLVELCVFAIPVFGRRQSKPGQTFATFIEVIVRVLTLDDPLHATQVALNFSLSQVEGVADVRINCDAFVIRLHLAVDEGLNLRQCFLRDDDANGEMGHDLPHVEN